MGGRGSHHGVGRHMRQEVLPACHPRLVHAQQLRVADGVAEGIAREGDVRVAVVLAVRVRAWRGAGRIVREGQAARRLGGCGLC